MKEILWFRRDLRIHDNALLSHAKDYVFPIFIFDTNILNNLNKNDPRISFLYEKVLYLKKQLQSINLDLAIFHGDPEEIFKNILNNSFDCVLCSVDYDSYAIKRDEKIQSLISMKRYNDSFLINPPFHLKKDLSPYKKFTPFYNALKPFHESTSIELLHCNKKLKLFKYDYHTTISLKDIGFTKQNIPKYLQVSSTKLIKDFLPKVQNYKQQRDYFYQNFTSCFSSYLRFGLISIRQVFNEIKQQPNHDEFIRQLFWREFYAYILFHFPKSEFENFNLKKVKWENDEKKFKAWCEGKTGIPIIDASMKCLNKTGLLHNRLRMIVASFLTKNLLIDWRKGEAYFKKKLYDYEASSNIGSWQWAASTGADSVPYFRIFNPYIQAKKFDKEALFIKEFCPELKDIDSKILNDELKMNQTKINNYPKAIVDLKISRVNAIKCFKK